MVVSNRLYYRKILVIPTYQYLMVTLIPAFFHELREIGKAGESEEGKL